MIRSMSVPVLCDVINRLPFSYNVGSTFDFCRRGVDETDRGKVYNKKLGSAAFACSAFAARYNTVGPRYLLTFYLRIRQNGKKYNF
jgi:hypothetical protein